MDDDRFDNLICDENPEFLFPAENNYNAINQSSPSEDTENPNVDNDDILQRLFRLPTRCEESLMRIFDIETDYMPRHTYLQRLKTDAFELSLRNDAVAWIFLASVRFDSGSMCTYLSVNYFDRFFSRYKHSGNHLDVASQLIAVTCFYIAAKIEMTNAPRIKQLRLVDEKYRFINRKIRIMEHIVLHNLQWKMHATTPYSFIDYFLSVISNGEPPLNYSDISELVILDTLKDIDYLEFKPSEIAAAVAISVSGEMEQLDIDAAISSFRRVEKASVVKCLLMLKR